MLSRRFISSTRSAEKKVVVALHGPVQPAMIHAGHPVFDFSSERALRCHLGWFFGFVDNVRANIDRASETEVDLRRLFAITVILTATTNGLCSVEIRSLFRSRGSETSVSASAKTYTDVLSTSVSQAGGLAGGRYGDSRLAFIAELGSDTPCVFHTSTVWTSGTSILKAP